MPETRLFEDRHFGVKRFDCAATGKVHASCAAGLLHANYRIPGLDFFVLSNVCLNLTKDRVQVYDFFRLMIFSVIISDRYDHAENFSFPWMKKGWK